MSTSSNARIGRRWLRVAALGLAVAGATVLVAREAGAHGTIPNLVTYCEAKHGRATNPMSVRYDTKNRHWRCVRKQYAGFGFVEPALDAPLDVYDACARQAKTRLAHFHEGSSLNNPGSVHCGIVEGTVSNAPAAQPPSVLKLCNASSEKTIYAAFAAWGGDEGRGWTSKGWYELTQNRCRTIDFGRPYEGKVFVYAEMSRRVWETGDSASFCVNGREPFEIPRSDEAACDANGLRRVKMATYQIGPGTNQWTFK
jgi:uncharacterized membrane protein